MYLTALRDSTIQAEGKEVVMTTAVLATCGWKSMDSLHGAMTRGQIVVFNVLYTMKTFMM
ncbi:hypothetical protein ACJIZ3_001509 [Penstemon smallii]|uniref:Uncharacterized protein n=1 Tax=Penstemon smallii TaxID=265156 RepID=A0ABD3U586_9LAMI